MRPSDSNAMKFSRARWYTRSSSGAIPGNSASERLTRKKVPGFFAVIDRTSSAVTTSYGTAAIDDATEGSGRTPAKL